MDAFMDGSFQEEQRGMMRARAHGAPLPGAGGVTVAGLMAAPVMEQAAFFALGLRYLPVEPRGLDWTAARSWGEGMLAELPAPPRWLIELSMAEDPVVARRCLEQGLTPTSLALGIPLMAAFLRRRWCLGRLSSEEICAHLAQLSDAAQGNLQGALRLPSAEARRDEVVDHGSAREELDAALMETLQAFDVYDRLIPRGVW